MATTTTSTTSTTSTTTTVYLTDGLIAHWTMNDEDIYGSTIEDQSTNGNDAEMNGDPDPGTCGAIINVLT